MGPNNYSPVRYKVLVADPAWPSKKIRFPMDNSRLRARSSAHKYQLMTLEDIKKYPLPPFLDDYCVLFLWRLASMQKAAIEVCEAWGFKPFSEIVWRKQTATGKDWFGMGTLVRGSHETCLIGTKRLPKPLVKNIRSIFSAPYTGVHSGKPDKFFEIVETMLPGPRLELFARKRRPGWDCFGLELEKEVD